MTDLPVGQRLAGFLSSPAGEKFRFSEIRIFGMVHASRPDCRGAIANVTNAGRDAVDAKVPLDEQHRRGRRSRVVLASSAKALQ
jgi:hypothetical protein